jgi:hypothetical protein
MVHLVQTVHRYCTERTETSFHLCLCHTGVPSGASTIISKPAVRFAQTVHLSYTKTNTISKRIETIFYMTHITQEFHRVRPKRFLKLWYVWCKTMDRNEILHDPRHLGVPSGASKKISKLIVRSVRTVHQSRVKNSTISKRTETSFHLSLVT